MARSNKKAPAIEDVPLGFLVNANRMIEAKCIHCVVRQHVDIDALIEQHGNLYACWNRFTGDLLLLQAETRP